MENIPFNIEILYGHVESKYFYRVEDGALVYYGYSIHYDRSGKEVSRTDPEPYGRLFYQ